MYLLSNFFIIMIIDELDAHRQRSVKLYIIDKTSET